jgi:hypothetical protein
MGSAKQIAHLCINSLRRWGFSPRHYVIAGLVVLWIHALVSPVLRFSQMVDVKVTPWVFPFTLGKWNYVMLTMLGVVLLFCDAPFINSSTPYECVRAGKKRWVVAQLCYVGVASLIFVLFLMLISILCLLPHIDFANEWGRVLNTLAQTSAGVEYGGMPITYGVMFRYSPLGALGLAALTLYLQTVFVGLVMFALNMVAKRGAGVVAGLLLAFIPAVAQIVYVPRVYYFVPTAWANLTVLDMTGTSARPSLAYALGMLVGLIVVLTTVVLLVHKKKEIEVLMPV